LGLVWGVPITVKKEKNMIAIALLANIVLTLFTIIFIGVYWKEYGPQNFLWMSDIALFLTVAALWIESPFLISLCTVSFLPMELVWNIDFFIHLITGKNITGLSHYMFEKRYTLFVRSLSLFHVLLVPIWVWCTMSWGYDKRAIIYAIPMIWIIFLATYFWTKPNPENNINWVYMPVIHRWQYVSQIMWLMLLLIGYPLLVCLPIHFFYVSQF
jgi:hypothetical protein